MSHSISVKVKTSTVHPFIVLYIGACNVLKIGLSTVGIHLRAVCVGFPVVYTLDTMIVQITQFALKMNELFFMGLNEIQLSLNGFFIRSIILFQSGF